MEALYSALLAVSAFWLGACPFSLWIGRLVLHRDIRGYGDHNPGAANVFRAGGRISGCLALILDIGKGVPFVALTHTLFGLPEAAALAVGICAILGHAFSPFLRLKGGKAVAITFGVLVALPQYEILIAFIAFVVLGFLFIEVDSWTVMLGPIGTLAYLVATTGGSWESLFMLCVLVILAVKHFNELRNIPRHKGRLIYWLQSTRRRI